jgi:hypothetical protein
MLNSLALEIDFPIFNCISSFYNLLKDFDNKQFILAPKRSTNL